MGRRKRLGRKLWCPGIARNLRQEATVPHRGDIRGDILRRDDAMKLDKTRWERISKFSMKRIFGPEGDQLWMTGIALGLSKNIWWNELVLRFTDLLYFWSLSFPPHISPSLHKYLCFFLWIKIIIIGPTCSKFDGAKPWRLEKQLFRKKSDKSQKLYPQKAWQMYFCTVQ